MEAERSYRSPRRRSDRVSIAFPLEVSGIDASGRYFVEKTQTMSVSRYGCSVALPFELPLEHQISLYRPSTQERTTGRIVAQQPDTNGYLYGVGVDNSCESLWAMSFSTSFHEKLLDNIYDGIYFVNRERTITYWNEGAERLTGYASEEAVGKRCRNNFLEHVDASGNPLCLTGCPLSKAMEDGQPQRAEFYVRHKNGHRVPVWVRALPMRNNSGVIVGAVEVFTDMTSKEVVEKRVRELENLAYCDALTQLSNRRYLEMKVAQALQEHQQFGRDYGLLLLDLDRFKQVNDNFGHEKGDAVLKMVSETLVHTLRPVDLVGRWGGEEFLALVPDMSASVLGDVAERCRALICRSSIPHGGSRISVTASIGATLFAPTDTADTVVRRADELMYQSKRSGGNQTTVG